MEEQLMIDQPFITDPDVIAQFNELGIDPTGKTADQLQAEIDTLMIKTGATTFFDPKDPLDYLTLGLGLTGIGTGAAVGIKGLRTAKKTAEAATLMQKAKKLKDLLNPFYRRGPTPGPTITPLSPPGPAYSNLINPTIPIGIKTPQGLIYSAGGIKAADEALEETRLADQAALIQDDINALKIEETKIADQVIENVQKNLEAQKDEDSQASNVAVSSLERPSDKVTEQTDRPSISDIFGTPQFDRFIRNVGAKLVETGQVGAGLAQGAAAAAEERAAEELALRLELIKASGKNVLKPELQYKMDADYIAASNKIAENAASLNFLNQVESILSQTSVTGVQNLFKQYKYNLSALVDPNTPMDAKTQVENLLREISIGNADQVLGQASGRLSDKDIELARQLVGSLEGLSGLTTTSDEILSIIAKRRADLERDQAEQGTIYQRLEDRYIAAGVKPPPTDLFEILDALKKENQKPTKNEEVIDIKLQPEEELKDKALESIGVR